MGSEFSYEDLGSQEKEKYNFKWLKDENGEHIIERTSKKKSAYSKQVMWVKTKKLTTSKVEYYDRRGDLLKIAEFSGHKPYTVKGKTIYRAGQIHMKNVQTKKESIIKWTDRKMGVSFRDKEFSKKSLK